MKRKSGLMLAVFCLATALLVTPAVHGAPKKNLLKIATLAPDGTRVSPEPASS